MARADLLCELIKYGLINDSVSFRKAAFISLKEVSDTDTKENF